MVGQGPLPAGSSIKYSTCFEASSGCGMWDVQCCYFCAPLTRAHRQTGNHHQHKQSLAVSARNTATHPLLPSLVAQQPIQAPRRYILAAIVPYSAKR
jgi:hypothetical protein